MLDVVIEMLSPTGELIKTFLSIPYSSWKSLLLKNYEGYVFKYIDKYKNELIVDFSKYYEDSSCFNIINNDGTTERLAALSFMRFKVVNPKAKLDPLNSPIVIVIERLEAAFKHDLTEIGIKNVQRLETDLAKRFENWNIEATRYIAPIVSLCQSSGSGKSKLSLELLKRNPGFYTVLRLSLTKHY